MFRKMSALVLVAFAAVACSSTDRVTNQSGAINPVKGNLSLVKETLERYHDDGRYGRDLEIGARRGQACMDRELDSLGTSPGRTALVLDVDDTALSNYDWMVSVDFLRNSPLLSELFPPHAMAADTPPIVPVLELFRHARQRGVAVFFISGRSEALRPATEANLEKVGYRGFEGTYFTRPGYSEKSIVPFKVASRRDIERKGYTIVANVGDQQSDVEGGVAKCPQKLVDPYYFIP